jgi:predicted phosphodiesterase
MAPLPHRRRFLAAAAAGVAVPAVARAADDPKPKDEPVAFFVIGDTHFLADKDDPAKLDRRSGPVCGRLVDVLNKLPGQAIPEKAGGGAVLAPRGVIHAGDCIDTGDKADDKRQATEWAAFTDAYGLTGKDGRLKLPVYEVYGNHDSPKGDGLVVKKIAERNKTRPGVTNVSKNGVHYSWDWGGVHFVNLGIVVGQAADVTRKRRYPPLDSLDFLVSDLKDKVGTSGKPVVLTHHVDVLRYAQKLPVDDRRAEAMEWDPADVKGFHDTLKGYSVAAILYGHTHTRNVFRWDGTTSKTAKDGMPTYNVDNGSHFNFKSQAFFYFEVRPDQVLVREYATTDNWETAAWTPQSWTTPVVKAGG